MKKTILIVLGLVVVGGGSFYGGVRYDQNSVASARQTRFAAGAGNFVGRGGNGNMRGSGFASGEVIAKDDKSLTIKLRSGANSTNNSQNNSTGSKIVFFSPSSTVSKSVNGNLDDVKIGEEVVVSGNANSDGSVNAETIQIRPSQVNR